MPQRVPSFAGFCSSAPPRLHPVAVLLQHRVKVGNAASIIVQHRFPDTRADEHGHAFLVGVGVHGGHSAVPGSRLKLPGILFLERSGSDMRAWEEIWPSLQGISW